MYKNGVFIKGGKAYVFAKDYASAMKTARANSKGNVVVSGLSKVGVLYRISTKRRKGR